MRSLVRICIILFVSLCLGCNRQEKPEEVVRIIPEEDRFVYETGDPLIYDCSDTSSDTVQVINAVFYKHSWTSVDMFGNVKDYTIEHCKITLEITDATWLTILHHVCPEGESCGSCVNIETEAYLDGIPGTTVYFGCGSPDGFSFAESPAVSEMDLNGRTFNNVYSFTYDPSGSEEFSMYWSLKYGIIRFEGNLGETFYSWDLEAPD